MHVNVPAVAVSVQTVLSHLSKQPHLATHCVALSNGQIVEFPLQVHNKFVGGSLHTQFSAHPHFAGVEQVVKSDGHT